jgi:hypothetical protein
MGVRITVVLLVLAGCATEQWSRPGASYEQASRDAYECRHGSFRAVIWDDQQELYRLCMQGRGYHAE